MLARSVTKWNTACGEILTRLMGYISPPKHYRHYFFVGGKLEDCKLWLLQDASFAGDLQDSTSTSGGVFFVFGSQTSVPISWMCKKQTAVSHSSAESETISLDASLRMEGIPAFQLWDCVLQTFSNSAVKQKLYVPKSQASFFHSLFHLITCHFIWLRVPSNIPDSQPGFTLSRTTIQSFV